MFIILPEKTIITTSVTQSYEELVDWCLKEEDYYTACGNYYRYVLVVDVFISESLENELFFGLYESVETALEKTFRDIDGHTSWKNNFMQFKVVLENPVDIKDIERTVREALIRKLFDYCDDFGCEIVEK